MTAKRPKKNKFIKAWLDEHRPEVVAVERVFSQHNVRTVMGTAQASAVAMLCAARRGLPRIQSDANGSAHGFRPADLRAASHRPVLGEPVGILRGGIVE